MLAGGREPLISRIKLAWWRDALEALDGGPAPSEPVLQAVAAELRANDITGRELGKSVGDNAVNKAQRLFGGSAS